MKVVPLILLLLGCLTAACRSGQPVDVTSGVTPKFRCPAPLIRWAGEPSPRGIDLENRASDSVTVFVDRCLAHSRLGTVAPGQTRRFRLPDQLYLYDGHLCLHTFRGALRQHTPLRVRTDTVFLLTGVIPAQRPESLAETTPLERRAVSDSTPPRTIQILEDEYGNKSVLVNGIPDEDFNHPDPCGRDDTEASVDTTASVETQNRLLTMLLKIEPKR